MAVRALMTMFGLAATSLLPIAGAAAQVVPWVDVRLSNKPFAIVPEDVARVVAVRKGNALSTLRVVTAVCGFAKRPGGELNVRVSDADGYGFRVGRLVAIAAIEQDEQWVNVIRPVRKSEEARFGCDRPKN